MILTLNLKENTMINLGKVTLVTQHVKDGFLFEAASGRFDFID